MTDETEAIIDISGLLESLGMDSFINRFIILDISVTDLVVMCRLLTEGTNKKKFKKKMRKLQAGIGMSKLQAKILFKGVWAIIGELKKNQQSHQELKVKDVNKQKKSKKKTNSKEKSEKNQMSIEQPKTLNLPITSQVKNQLDDAEVIKIESSSEEFSDNAEFDIIINDIKQEYDISQSEFYKQEKIKAKCENPSTSKKQSKRRKAALDENAIEKSYIRSEIRSEQRLRDKLQKLCTQMENAISGKSGRKRGRPWFNHEEEIFDYDQKVSDLQFDLSYRSEQINNQILDELTSSSFKKQALSRDWEVKSESSRAKDKSLSTLSLRERMKQNSEIAKRSIMTLELIEDEEKSKRTNRKYTRHDYGSTNNHLYDRMYERCEVKPDPETDPYMAYANSIKHESQKGSAIKRSRSRKEKERMNILKDLGLVCKRGRQPHLQ